MIDMDRPKSSLKTRNKPNAPIRWATHTTASNNSTGLVRNTVGHYDNASFEQKVEYGLNLVESRGSESINPAEKANHQGRSVSGITPDEASYLARLLDIMNPCEAIRYLYSLHNPEYEPGVLPPVPADLVLPANPGLVIQRSANIPSNVVIQPSSSLRRRGITIPPTRIRRNIRGKPLHEYTEEIRLINHIGAQFHVWPMKCLQYVSSNYTRPNNLPSSATYMRLNEFVSKRGGKSRRKTKHTTRKRRH